MADLLKIEPTEPVFPDVVEVLSQALQDAKDGKISAVAIASVTRDGRGAQTWSTLPNVSLIVGSAARLLHHLNTAGDEA